MLKLEGGVEPPQQEILTPPLWTSLRGRPRTSFKGDSHFALPFAFALVLAVSMSWHSLYLSLSLSISLSLSLCRSRSVLALGLDHEGLLELSRRAQCRLGLGENVPKIAVLNRADAIM